MSPEQCTGQAASLDIRSDVYALGVVMYELVCRRPPYDVSQATLPEAVRTISEGTVRSPSTIDKSLRGNVEAILLKCLEKRPERRYASTAHFADDIRRHLAGDPTQAKPPSIWQRCTHWMGAHPVATTAAASVAVAALILSTTFVSLRAYAFIPDKTEISYDRKNVKVCSAVGNPLYEWRVSPDGAFSFAEPLDRPSLVAGPRLLLLGVTYSSALSQQIGNRISYQQLDSSPRFSGIVATPFVAKPTESPLWVASIELNDLPFGESWPGYEFKPRFGKQMEVFASIPGPEVLVVHDHIGHARAIRLYSQSGEILYQVWHSGSISAVVWLSEAEILICAGPVNHPDWRPRPDSDGVRALGNPRHVFAIRPKIRCRLTGYLSPRADDIRLKPEWVRQIVPAEVTVNAKLKLSLPEINDIEFANCFRLGIRLNEPLDIGTSLLVDETGSEVTSRRLSSDAYLDDQDLPQPQFPNPDVLGLRRFPD